MMHTDRRAAAATLSGPPHITRLDRRKTAFLEAADAVFREKGFAQSTVDDVIARSGGSRQTLYALFGGKEGLFKAIVVERSLTIYAGMATGDSLKRSPEEALLDMGVRYLELMFSPDAIGHYRMVLSEGVRLPEVAEAYWAAGPAHNLDRLSKYLSEQVDKGALRISDPMAAAHHFWGMLQGRTFLQVALGLRAQPPRQEIEAIVRGAVTQFLDGCRASVQLGPDDLEPSPRNRKANGKAQKKTRIVKTRGT